MRKGVENAPFYFIRSPKIPTGFPKKTNRLSFFLTNFIPNFRTFHESLLYERMRGAPSTLLLERETIVKENLFSQKKTYPKFHKTARNGANAFSERF